MFYDMDGGPISIREWMHIFESDDKQIADDTLVHGDHITRVSTVYLGLDHGLIPDHPLIFETMLFSSDENLDTKMWRYVTKEQAEKGHVDALADLVLQKEVNGDR